MAQFRSLNAIKKDVAAGKSLSSQDKSMLKRHEAANVRRATKASTPKKPRSAAQRRSEFKSKATIKATGGHTAQTRAQAKRMGIENVELPNVLDLVKEVYQVDGRSLKKSLLGMAAMLNAPESDRRRIAAADEELLAKAYNENSIYFEAYWLYPVTPGDDRGDTLEMILSEVGI